MFLSDVLRFVLISTETTRTLDKTTDIRPNESPIYGRFRNGFACFGERRRLSPLIPTAIGRVLVRVRVRGILQTETPKPN
jgi:hypothetical protein